MTPRYRTSGVDGRHDPLRRFALFVDRNLAVSKSVERDMAMNALQKDKAKAPIRPTGKKPSAAEMLERATKRWPKVMARLGE